MPAAQTIQTTRSGSSLGAARVGPRATHTAKAPADKSAAARPTSPRMLQASEPLAALAAAPADAPIGLQSLRAAQLVLQDHVRRWLCAALHPGVGPPPPLETGAADEPKLDAAEAFMRCLCELELVWRNATLRPLLSARHLPHELAALVEAAVLERRDALGWPRARRP